ncbi:hypothetical protein DSO57_1037423 [Entomophthora muscae]|uniref:Uncharacterized protein n=1 Tax=Entomophthora muscae TaxID=34485 RepID=A0ACC2SZ99_9FUNG|nr:hypothetical protein DSO57_1037423 [Entomophthora muscae]
MEEWYESLIDNGMVPDFALRLGVRLLSRVRLSSISQPSIEKEQETKMQYIQRLRESDIAIHTDKANEQHYEVPTGFIKACLGKRMKYSACLYPDESTTLDEAEELMLQLYCERAQVEDGMKLMDLGCGWGSLGLYMAEKYPKSSVTSLSNSRTQKEYIESIATEKCLHNIQVITGDVKDFDFEVKPEFDRILSIEMFEHMKNYRHLFDKVSSWLKPQGKLFLQVFCHHNTPYDFDTEEGHSWMARYFFTGGTMPSLDLFLYFQDQLSIESHWYVDGKHYGRTSEDWLKTLDENRELALEHLREGYGGEEEANKWFNRWRLFYLAVAETFNYGDGQIWGLGHYLFQKK